MGGSAPSSAVGATAVLQELAPPQLDALADALEQCGPTWPTSLALVRVVPVAHAAPLAAALTALANAGMAPGHVALLLRAVSGERRRAQQLADRVGLVWTGPELPNSESRDTEVVVEELFARARDRVLVAGYVVHDGRSIFAKLAHQMDSEPGLRASVFLNVSRGAADTRTDAEIVRTFGERFVARHWPATATRLPTLYYDPRSLALDAAVRAVLHAKCVVVDDEVALVTSANLTGAAQRRNIEAGVLVSDARLARRLRRQFEALVDRRLLLPVLGGGDR